MTRDALEPYRAMLAESVVWARLAPEDLDRVLGSCRLVEVQAGQTLLAEGRRGAGLYVILEGQVEVFLPEQSAGLRRPSRVRLNVLGPGRCLGEYGVIDDMPSSASASALTPARLCLLAAADFRRIVDEHDRIGRIVYANLLRFLVGRLRSKDKELDLIVFVEGPGRAG